MRHGGHWQTRLYVLRGPGRFVAEVRRRKKQTWNSTTGEISALFTYSRSHTIAAT